MEKTRIETLIAQLRALGGRVTPQRLAILKFLLASQGQHLTIEQIYEQVRREHPMISVATVYKTIAMLVEMGAIQSIGVIQGATCFDVNPRFHPHIVCSQCGRITDLPENDLSTWIEKIRTATGYDEVTPEILFYGRCPECQKAASASE